MRASTAASARERASSQSRRGLVHPERQAVDHERLGGDHPEAQLGDGAHAGAVAQRQSERAEAAGGREHGPRARDEQLRGLVDRARSPAPARPTTSTPAR